MKGIYGQMYPLRLVFVPLNCLAFQGICFAHQIKSMKENLQFALPNMVK